jgi:hypothetical protein
MCSFFLFFFKNSFKIFLFFKNNDVIRELKKRIPPTNTARVRQNSKKEINIEDLIEGIFQEI